MPWVEILGALVGIVAGAVTTTRVLLPRVSRTQKVREAARQEARKAGKL